MAIEQTIEVPAGRRLTIDIPPEVPVGKAILTFTPAQSGHDSSCAAPANQAGDSSRKPISQYFGVLSPDTYGDGVLYQRKIRDEMEWLTRLCIG